MELIHSDVCGSISQSARDDYRYFITSTDDYSWYSYVCLVRYKNEIENQLDKRIKALWTDRRGEYLSNEFSTYERVFQCAKMSYLYTFGGTLLTPAHTLNVVPSKSVEKNSTCVVDGHSAQYNLSKDSKLWGICQTYEDN